METPADKRRIRRITKNDLLLLACNKRNDLLLQDLIKTDFGFQRFLMNREYLDENGKINFNTMAALVQVIRNACCVGLSRLEGSLLKFLNMLKECKQFIFNDVHVTINMLLLEKHSVSLVTFTSQYLIILQKLLRHCECREIVDDVFPAIQNYFNTMRVRKIRDLDAVKAEFDLLKRNIDRLDDPNSILDDVDELSDIKNLSIVPRESDVVNCETPDLPQNIIDGPYTSVKHYLGVHFRLTREDMLRSFRECVSNCLNSDEIALMRSETQKYDNVFVTRPAKYKIEGLCYSIKVQTFKEVNWKDALLPGSLVCLTPNRFNDVIFASVRDLRASTGKSKECTVKLVLEDDLYEDVLHMEVQYLMVVPNAYFECYKHVLAAIKSFGPENFPLSDYLVFLESSEPSPEYLRDPKMLKKKKYSLCEKCQFTSKSCEIPDKNEDLCKEFDPLNYDEWPSANSLGLDEHQYEAYKLALTNKIAIIQGPPGTGKTFMGRKIVKALLRNTKLTPIVICCLTNHALDQFLEKLLEENVENIVRLGSQSKSTILQSYTMENMVLAYKLSKDQGNSSRKTDKVSKSILARMRRFMPKVLESTYSGEYDPLYFDFKDKCRDLNNDTDLLDFCENKYLESSALNAIIDSDKKEELSSKSSSRSSELAESIMEWLACSNSSKLYEICEKRFAKMKEYESKITTLNKNIWSLNLTQRFEHFYLWRRKCLEIKKKEVEKEKQEYKEFKKFFRGKGTESSLKVDILHNAHVIGVTTTGAAKFREILDYAQPSILIIEEAAEVLESHTIASLLPSIKHMILIGDHKQLRPMPSNHELSEVYNLKISMFERLFTNNVPNTTLVSQHRMKPCIADLLVNEYLYEDLISHKSVYEYEEIKGLKSSMFFLDHDKPESDKSSSTSSSNEFEAKMCVALAKYLLSQSYTVDEITILATYALQVTLIQKLLFEAELDGIKLTTVDNFQGEENEIIIVSFVRNNRNGVIGFLKENNRVCVALSRAKKGMYCLGNFKMYASKSPLWNTIVPKLEAQGMIGDKIPLRCSRHGIETSVETEHDIYKFIKQGCREPCNFKLPCGHNCTKKCHNFDADHKLYQCQYPCEKFIDKDRKCPRLCFQPCKRVKKNAVTLPCGHRSRTTDIENFVCREEVQRLLPCNHLVTVDCYIDISQYECPSLETVLLSCGHTAKVPCFKKDKTSDIICHEKRPLLSPCGHTVDVGCCLDLEGNDLLSYCNRLCGVLLNCQHLCQGDCRLCVDFGIHALCTEKCDQKLSCGHPCKGYCNSPCPPCKETCGLVCPHSNSKDSRCINSCYRPCIECKLPCELRCDHVKCPNLCYQECTVKPCIENCQETLPCGHECIGLCGDPCPYLCRVCNENDIESGNPKVDRYVMLQDCDHVIEVKTLTEHIEECSLCFEWPSCPSCSKPIYQSLRFKNYLMEAKKRLLQSCDTKETVSEIQFLLHTAYDEDYIIPAVFNDIHKKILRILENEQTTDVLVVLKLAVVNLRSLVKIYELIDNWGESTFNSNVLYRFETLLLWLSNHLKYASYQQLMESEKAIEELEKLVKNQIKMLK